MDDFVLFDDRYKGGDDNSSSNADDTSSSTATVEKDVLLDDETMDIDEVEPDDIPF